MKSTHSFAPNRLVTMLALTLSAPAVIAETYPMPPAGGDTIGEIQYTRALQEDTLLDIARRFSLGQDEIVLANIDVDRWMPGEGKEVLLPKLFVLPEAPRNGVVLNVPEMRLYYFQPKKGTVESYPVSIGRMDWKTPQAATTVVQKQTNPVWRPPESIKREHAANGDFLPDTVPAGPNNPLGKFAMKLGIPGYLIHGTDVEKEYGIGMRVTHGCVRMYPEDIQRLFPLVPLGAPVHIVNQPVKVGWKGQDLYVEVHPPLDEDKLSYEQLLAQAMSLLQKKVNKNNVPQIDAQALKAALNDATGIPVLITKPAAAPQTTEAEAQPAPEEAEQSALAPQPAR